MHMAASEKHAMTGFGWQQTMRALSSAGSRSAQRCSIDAAIPDPQLQLTLLALCLWDCCQTQLLEANWCAWQNASAGTCWCSTAAAQSVSCQRQGRLAGHAVQAAAQSG